MSSAIALASQASRSVSLPWLPFLPLLALPFVGTSPESVDGVIVAMELIFLIMAVRNPLWVLGALALSELTIGNYFLQFGDLQISSRLFISLASLLIVLPYLSRGADLGPRARALIITAASFIALTTVANFIALDLGGVVKFFRLIITGFISLLIVPLVIKRREDLLQIGLVALTIAAASAAAALAQQLRGAPIFEVVPNSVNPLGFADWRGRSLGLAESPIYLTNSLLFFIFPLMGILFTRGVSGQASRYVVGLVLLLAIALYFTLTRSWVVSAAPATAAMAFGLRGRVGRELILLLLLAGFGFWYWADYSGSRYSLGPDSDDSAAARPVLWAAGLNIALDHPLLGIGHYRFREVSPEYADTIDPDLLARQDAGTTLGRETPHNDYLNVWLSFGTAALVLYGLLLIFTGHNFLSAARDFSDPVLKGIALGGLGALVAFCVNSFFQNLFTSTLTVWILAGLSLALTKLARAPEAPKLEPRR